MRAESSQMVIRGRGDGETADDVFNGDSFVTGWIAEGGAIDGAGPAQETSSAARQKNHGRWELFAKDIIRQPGAFSIERPNKPDWCGILLRMETPTARSDRLPIPPTAAQGPS